MTNRLAILAGIVIFVVTVVVLWDLLRIYCFPWESGAPARGDGWRDEEPDFV